MSEPNRADDLTRQEESAFLDEEGLWDHGDPYLDEEDYDDPDGILRRDRDVEVDARNDRRKARP
ncbi:MAG TPA: hypothetical protein VKQ11_00670 [Candidatus Sulfotelmatobacter sp.]|nr:hypothetical protein [Candidatus Sulfotelmatobacter sp.]